MRRFLLLAILGVLACIWFFRRKRRTSARSHPVTPHKMVPCQRCGVYVSASQAVYVAGVVYCCDTHAFANRRAT